MENVYTVDLAKFLNDPTSAKEECEKVLESFRKTGILFVKDPRVEEKYNKEFVDMMEKYYNQPTEKKLKDTRPELSYQVGSTPELTELPRDHSEFISKFDEKNAPHKPEGKDPKWRFFWRAGEKPKETKFQTLNADPVIPEDFPEWPTVMNRWSKLMLDAVFSVSEMLALGYGFEKDEFTKRMKYGPHLLAPTGSDLEKYGKLGTVLAGFHYDLNFITIHGKSRFPGLYVWLRDGTKILVRVPDGCLLCQAGKQLEWLTGGDIEAGFHEVVVTKETLDAIEKAKKENRILWRVSSTLFSHIGSDEILAPIGKLATEESKKKYPEIYAGDRKSVV